jgi:hypothetical protein
MKIRNSWFAGVLLAIAVGAVPAQAAYVVDTGLPDTSQPSTSLRYGSSGIQFHAASFSLAYATNISSIETYLEAIYPVNGQATFSLTPDGATPGTPFFSQTFQTTQGTGWMGLTGLDLDLAAGTYWLILTTDGSYGLGIFRFPSSPLPRYLVTHTGTPEGDGFSWGDASTKAYRIGGVSAVPEPASWALMIGGFALVGASMRRSRRSTRVAFA